jgi:hypothetical protein
MARDGKEIAALIREAFRGVTLGRGVGLWEGQALDDYADEATRHRYRECDEKHDWERIPVDSLNRCQSSLSFFDAEGMRFHLAAFLIAELESRADVGCVFHLTHLDDYAKSKLTALSREQTKAVREFLLFLRDLPDYEFDRAQIERALSDYWTSDEDSDKS